MPGTREIKKRIKSVINIKQITKAMQLVAASKMRRAQNLSVNSDAYAYGALEILLNLTKAGPGVVNHPFWRTGGSAANALVLITTNRGFCGSLNLNLFNALVPFVAANSIANVITVGKKGRVFAKKLGLKIIADFSDIQDRFSIKEISPLVYLIVREFQTDRCGKIFVAFSEFSNTLLQKPVINQLLPLNLESFMAITETSLKAKKFFLTPQDSSAVVGAPPYTFEPSPEIVFEKIVPYLLEVEIYKALLEARASEHSARMVAMKNAADKAGELIEDLKLAYNQARQSLITKEIAEISAGTLAIAGKKQNR